MSADATVALPADWDPGDDDDPLPCVGGLVVADDTSPVVDGRYEIGEVIGRGGMGEVHRALDRRLGRQVAFKWLRAEMVTEDEVRARFEDEARHAARLQHPGVAAVYDSGEWSGRPYIVMECLPGRTLSDDLADGPLPESRVREIALDLAAALEATHAVGVIHRDVKPANILLTADGRAKLADFGIATSTDARNHSQAGTVVGTPAYLAPELLDHQPATPQSDLYSLGVVLYEALTGERPFRGDTPLTLAHSINTTTPVRLRVRLPDLDVALASAIDAAMAKDPAHRPSSAATFAAIVAWDELLPSVAALPAAAA